MKQDQKLSDSLRGTACALCAVLFTVIASIASDNLLIPLLAAAALLYLCIGLFRTADRTSRKRRILTAFLLYLPLIGGCCLLLLCEPLRMRFLYAVLDSLDFYALSAALFLYLPASFVIMGIAAAYAAQQKTHPVVPLCLMYLLYAVCQADAFRLALKKTISSDILVLIEYTRYARNGFFALCALAVINFVIILLLNRSVRTGSSARPKRAAGLAAALCLYTAFIAVTELAQMTVYIRARGLSERRLFAAWFTLLLGAAFLVLLVKQFVRKLPSAAVVTVCAAVMLGMLYRSSPAERIAAYNIARYENGTLDELDVPMLCELSGDACAVMAQHQETLERAGQWEYYLAHAESAS